MCGILGLFDLKPEELEKARNTARELSSRQRHRGPDWSGIYVGKQAVFAHERLAIIDMETGEQPLFNQEASHVLLANGEIYNYRELHEAHKNNYEFQTGSDCESILALYKAHGMPTEHGSFLNELCGMFAFILYDQNTDEYLIARDYIGIIPLYFGYDDAGKLYVASEMKSIIDHCTTVNIFPPGHYMHSKIGKPVRYYTPAWREYNTVLKRPALTADKKADVELLRTSLEKAVHSHLMSDVPYGVLLSGGLDSSLVAAIAARYAAHRIEDDDKTQAWWPRLHSFAIGLKGSPDLEAAAKVGKSLDTVHHNFMFTIDDGLDALSDVIYHLETYDVTTVRASTPMYLLARKIKAMGVKMVLSGEGADEIFGGYLYFHYAPSDKDFHEETVRKLDRLHYYDCLRANKSMLAWGVEPRVPFLDRRFLDVAMNILPQDKMINNGKGGRAIEKRILREAFQGYLPEEILWRQKEQFSDGVGYSWIDSLKAFAEKEVSDTMMSRAEMRFPINTPQSKEAYLYRSIFEKHFNNLSAALTVPVARSAACSTEEAYQWMLKAGLNMNDPSGRTIKGVHEKSY